MLKRTGFLLGLIVILLCFFTFSANAQEGDLWTLPIQLSGANSKAGEATMVVDRYGYVHVFWSEELENTRTIIQYTRFDGQTWTKPTDFHVTPELIPIGEISAFIDARDTVHVIWSQGFDQMLFYSRAPLQKASSSTNWVRPYRLNFPSGEFRLLVDSQNNFHLFYTSFGKNLGIYYVKSKDQGKTWSPPRWLDPDMPDGLAPTSISFAMDDKEGMHATWAYKDVDENAGDWVRYIHSLDGGDSWSKPFTITKNSDGDAELNAFVRPNMVINGQEIHIVWAGGDLLYRHHRFSIDGGQTWSETKPNVFGNLNGQAGDGLGVDGLGRIHFFGQIRFPQGIWHSVWDHGQWSPPLLVYLMRVTSTEGYGDAVLAHRTFPVIRNGNQLILTFTDEPANPDRRLFVMYRDLPDVPPSSAAITPIPLPIVSETPDEIELVSSSSIPTPSPTPSNDNQAGAPASSAPASLSNQPFIFAIGPVLIILGLVLIVRVINRRG